MTTTRSVDRHQERQLNVRVSESAHAALAKLTKLHDRSQGWVVEEALLEKLERDRKRKGAT